jgi:peptidoglycan/xylan/chitin deacetylase (PgdA/CDA1 family)
VHASTRLVASIALVLLAFAAQSAEPRGKVALTFDDLPLNGALPPGVKPSDIARDALAVLNRHRIPPSYGFVNARKLERDPDGAAALRLWVAAGNPLGNHTYAHPDLTTTGVEAFEQDILRNEPVLELLMPEGGAHDWRWFRYPFLHEGETLEKRKAIRDFLKSNRYRIAQTTIDYEDYLWNSAFAACVAAKDAKAQAWLSESYLATARDYIRVQRQLAHDLFGREINHVLLLHLGAFSATILPDLFALLEDEGFEFVTLEEAQSDPAYDDDPNAALKWGGTLTEQIVAARGIAYPKVPDKPREKLGSICR